MNPCQTEENIKCEQTYRQSIKYYEFYLNTSFVQMEMIMKWNENITGYIWNRRKTYAKLSYHRNLKSQSCVFSLKSLSKSVQWSSVLSPPPALRTLSPLPHFHKCFFNTLNKTVVGENRSTQKPGRCFTWSYKNRKKSLKIEKPSIIPASMTHEN